MKKILSILVFALFILSISTAQVVTADPSASPDKTKVAKKSTETYVYIKEGGKKYHKKNCSLVKTGKTRVTLSEALKKGYTPCKVCKPVAQETKVMVNAQGKKYHKKGCKMVKKDAKALTVSEAVKKGYTPCKICHPETQKEKK
jgi:methylphosphotriester-DNA--protein-cysteine methyltransferase